MSFLKIIIFILTVRKYFFWNYFIFGKLKLNFSNLPLVSFFQIF